MCVRILKNDQQVWPRSGWQTVPVNRVGIDYEVRTEVQEGDRIVHVLQHNFYDLSSGIGWNPVI